MFEAKVEFSVTPLFEKNYVDQIRSDAELKGITVNDVSLKGSGLAVAIMTSETLPNMQEAVKYFKIRYKGTVEHINFDLQEDG